MRIKDIMEKKFASFQSDDSLDSMLETLSKRRITSAPVLDKGELVGIVSYADLARYFLPREAVSLPFMGGGLQGGSKILASAIARKPPFTLTPDQPVSLALGRLISTQDCVPVVSGKGLAGVVRPEHLVDFFLTERTKAEALSHAPDSAKSGHGSGDNSTAIDKMLEIVTRDGETTPKKVAAELKISEKTAEDLAKLLDKHRLVETSYSFLSGMVIRRAWHGDK